MPSTFSGLEISLRSLRAHQRAIEVVSHNIANVNNEGYSRQRALLSATDPYTVPSTNREESAAQIGTGVEVQKIYRYSAEYVNSQLRQEYSREQRWETIENGMDQIEVIFQEPSDSGISEALGKFWQAWTELSNTPEDLAARTAVTEAASSLTFSIRDADKRLRDLQDDMDLQVENTVDRINDIGSEIAKLNDPISKISAFGDQPNDLRDKRDQLLDELSQLVDINYYENQDGTVSIDIGGHALVMGQNFSGLETKLDGANNSLLKVAWKDSGTPLVVRGVSLEGTMSESEGESVRGQLGGSIYVRDVVINDQIKKLNTMTQALVESVNKVHATGYGYPDMSSDPHVARPGASVTGLTYGTNSPVAEIGTEISGTKYNPERGLAAGGYRVVTQESAGQWYFRVVDSNGEAIDINEAGGTGQTSDWQELSGVYGTTLDTGRGFAVRFKTLADLGGADPDDESSLTYNNFFSSDEANAVDVSNWARNQPFNVATAAGPDSSGDTTIVLAISRLRTATVVNGEYTVNSYYSSMVTDLGLDAKQAGSMTTNSTALVNHLLERKDEVSAVDMDEEAMNLIQLQRAYQGAARAMTTIDEMLDRLINSTGRVGL